MTHPQQTTREVLEQCVQALNHCMDAITERGLNGSPDQAEKWGLQLPLVRAESAITAARSVLAHHTPSTAGEATENLINALLDLHTPEGGDVSDIGVNEEQPAPSNMSDAYAGAREDLAIWKRRALEAEELNRKFIREINGPTHMGEPTPSTVGEPINGNAAFEEWWGREGQYHRAGGGDYEKTFAYHAWEAALLQSTADHIPDAVKMGATQKIGCVQHDCAECQARAAMPVGELTLEQITRIYDHYGGDMVNCAHAIARQAVANYIDSKPVGELTDEQAYKAIRDWCGALNDDDEPSSLDIVHATEAAHGITKKGAPGAAKEQTQ